MEITNYPNYLIYEDGRVQNKKTKRFLKYGNTRGYLYVNLYHQKKPKPHTIHRLVALHYIDNPENKPTVDHINRDTKDNRIENLRWATRIEQNENQKEHCIRKDNKSGHKGIFYHKTRNKWVFAKQQGKKRIEKSFKTKTEVLCFKFYFVLKNKLY